MRHMLVDEPALPPVGTSASLPPCTGRTRTRLAARLSTYAGTHPPSWSLGSHTQSEVSVCRSSGVCSSYGFSHDTASVLTLW